MLSDNGRLWLLLTYFGLVVGVVVVVVVVEVVVVVVASTHHPTLTFVFLTSPLISKIERLGSPNLACTHAGVTRPPRRLPLLHPASSSPPPGCGLVVIMVVVVVVVVVRWEEWRKGWDDSLVV